MTRLRMARYLWRAAALIACSASAAIAQDRAAVRKVTIKFRPMVGPEAFACGMSYTGVGRSNITLTPSAFALYVYDVRLMAADGAEIPVALDQDGLYQNGTLALLDFADGTGPCANEGPVHSEIQGSAPDRQYVGIKFVVGVPFERNHLDLTTQPSPLSLTRMFWSWNEGHKFLRFDAKSATGGAWLLHLGSTGCVPDGEVSAAPTSCAQGNRVSVSFPKFDIDKDVIIADAAVLFAGSSGTGRNACMSDPETLACPPMFAALGLPFNGSKAGSQTFLRPAAGRNAASASGK
jgi:uncharacterized repeat protein (TIGR04052 family)